MVMQKELKGRYMAIICSDVWPNSTSMQKYAEKNFSVGVELDNDDLYVITKPSIQTSFCFGYGYCGRSDEEDWQGARDMADHASRDTRYFMEENLKELNERIELLRDDHYVGYKYLAYSGQPEGSHLKTYSLCRTWDGPEEATWRWSNCRQVEKLSERERAALIEGYETAKQLFTKRLNTYLKRYGLSKLNTWTYLRD